MHAIQAATATINPAIALHIRRVAEEEALLLNRRQKMSPVDIIFYYTGRQVESAEFEEAVMAIAQFNRDAIARCGFAII